MLVGEGRLPVLVTHFHKRITGVSASTATILRQQLRRSELDVKLCGDALAGLPAPLSKRGAIRWIKTQKRTTIVHLRRNSEMWFGLLLRDVLRLDVKLVFTSAAKRHHSALPRWQISHMDGVIATSEEAANYVPHLLAIVPHGVDQDAFTPVDDLARAWAALGYGGHRGIATLGRVRAEKGTDRFVAALCQLLPHHPDCHALIIGLEKPADRAFGDGLRQQLAHAGILDRVHFTGALPPEHVAKILPALCLFAALPRYEGFGLTVLEAMASGVPVVATDTGAFAQMLEGGVGGTLVPNELVPNQDGTHISDAMQQYLENPQFSRDVGHKGRNRVIKAFSAKGESDAIIRCYRLLLRD